jgi:hypothetical protein
VSGHKSILRLQAVDTRADHVRLQYVDARAEKTYIVWAQEQPVITLFGSNSILRLQCVYT